MSNPRITSIIYCHQGWTQPPLPSHRVRLEADDPFYWARHLFGALLATMITTAVGTGRTVTLVTEGDDDRRVVVEGEVASYMDGTITFVDGVQVRDRVLISIMV